MAKKQQTTDKSKYPVSLTGFYKTKGGGRMQSAVLQPPYSEELLTKLSEIQIGGRLIIREVSEATRAKFPKMPDFFLEYQTPAQVAAEKDFIKSNKEADDLE